MDGAFRSVLLDDDSGWLLRFQAGLRQLSDNAGGQLSLWPVDDFVRLRRLGPCARRGMHQKLTDCWSYWSDVRVGYITEAAALRSPGAEQ